MRIATKEFVHESAEKSRTTTVFDVVYVFLTVLFESQSASGRCFTAHGSLSLSKLPFYCETEGFCMI